MDTKRIFNSAQRIYKYARFILLSLILVAVMNIALLFAGLDIYFMSGVFLSYFLSIGTKFTGTTTFVLSAILIPYVLCFFLSKRKRGWLVAALVMVCIDTLLLIVVALGSGTFITSLMDILYHGSAIVLLGNGVKNGKAATAGQERDPYHPAEAMETPIPPNSEESAFTDIVCDLKIYKNDRRFALTLTGIARFYENEAALLETTLGQRYSPIDEKLRFAFTDIARAYYTDVNELNAKIDLVDGRACLLYLTRATRPKLVDLLTTHGIAIEPYQ